MSKVSAATKARENAIIQEFMMITQATQKSASAFVKKHKTLDASLDAYFNDPGAQTSTAGNKGQEKKLGDIWEKYKDPSDPKLMKIDGTLEWCKVLDLDPSSDSVLFCLAADLGSKATGEWEKGPFVQGWMAMPGNIDSIAGMKAALPALRRKLNSDPQYFKKVYMHTFDLIKAPGSRVLGLEEACDMWNLFIVPAMASRPSALSYENEAKPQAASSVPKFTKTQFDMWIAFQKKRGKAVSKDTWSLLVDFIRSIDAEFKDYDESGAWPSTIDDFVEYVRSQQR